MKQQPEMPGGHDAPIQTAADDLLDGLGMARAMHRVLSTTPPTWSTRIGLFGRWGSGKTSILNLLHALEEANGAIVVRFSAWSAAGEAGVIAQFYAVLAARLHEEQIELPRVQRAKRIADKARAFSWLGRWGRTAVEELAPIPPSVIKAGAAALDKLGAAASAWAKIGRTDLEAITKILQGRRVVVFIDDLDRADPRLIPKTLLAMRELLDWPGFAFVLAFDKRAIASALASYSTAFGDDADGFLEKVIDVPFEVPEPSEVQLQRLARSAFAVCCDLMPPSSVAAISSNLPSQPRRVKIVARMVGALRPALVRHSSSDIDWVGLSLYLIVKEASPNLSDWVVQAASEEKSKWFVWGTDKQAREKQREEARAALAALLASPKPDDAARVIEAALRLLYHWQFQSKEVISYWVRLAFKEPPFTMAELLTVRDAFARERSPDLIREAIDAAAQRANVLPQEASADFLMTALSCYGTALESMASARTMGDLDRGRQVAEHSMLLLEHLFGQNQNRTLAAAATSAEAVVLIIGIAGRWLGWTRNPGEEDLRKREREIALDAARRCIDPETVFKNTDPFWNSSVGQDTERLEEWRAAVRKIVVPSVVTRLCTKFVEADGMLPVASGQDDLSAWLVESGKSPLYTEPAFTAQLLATFQQYVDLTDDARGTLSKNARLFLKQVMFQTRDASWGGREEGRTIHEKCPSILPAAWLAVVSSPVPYRMQSSLRELRKDLVNLNVSEEELPEPPWLAEVAPSVPPAPDSIA